MVKVYRYGCLPPVEGEDIVNEQLFRANRYKNRLVEIERRRRARIEEATAAVLGVQYPDLVRGEQEASARFDEIDRAIKRTRQQSRSRKVPEEMLRAYEEARAARREARARLREAKRLLRTGELRAAIEAINEEARAEVRKARAESGLYWGTYLVVEQDADRMRRAPGTPHFRRFDGTGRLATRK
jgi:hypothetical protein